MTRFTEPCLAIVLLAAAALCAHGQQTSVGYDMGWHPLGPQDPTDPAYQRAWKPKVYPQYQPPTPKPIPVGACLVSRNIDERENTSFGYWNHLALYVDNGELVESMPPRGVRLITYAEYRARSYSAVWVLFPKTPELGELAAARARSLVGTPYRKLSSVVPRVAVNVLPNVLPRRQGLNCVSLVSESYGVRLRHPDDAFRCTEAFATRLP